MKKITRRSDCPISAMLDILGDKWALLIMRDLIFKGKNTYSDFLKSKEKIATNILANRLAILESAGFISKHEHPESKSKFLYKPTAKGTDLLPVLLEIIIWSNKHHSISEKGQILAKIAQTNRDGLMKKILSQFQPASDNKNTNPTA